MEFELYITLLQTEWDMTPQSGLIALIGFIIWMIFALPAAAAKKERQDKAYAERKGITLEQLYQKRRNTADRKLNKTTKEMLFRKYNYQCNYCGDTEDLHIDHIFPFSKYRDNSFMNLQILCRDCNLSKGANEPDPKRHPELFGENSKYSMVENNISVDGVNIEIKNQKGKLNEAQIKALKEIENTFSNLGDKS